jgi:hypothetical protein
MANPTTNYSSGYPDAIYPKNTQQERSLADNRLIQRARDYNIHDQEICALQQYIGVHPTPGWSPTSGPTSGGPGGGTINERITYIGGTGNCIEQGVICNYGGVGGIDPGGLILAKTGELPEFVTPPTGCIPLEPPSPSGFYNPVFPDPPPWNPPTNPSYPPYPVPDDYPWPTDFDPEVDDGFPMGTWMQYMMWGVGYSQVQWQAQNAGNINLGPAGLTRAGTPGPWVDLMESAPVITESTQHMPIPEGQTFSTAAERDRFAMIDAFDITLTTLAALKNMLGVDYMVLTGNGTDTISYNPGTAVNFGTDGADHANVFTVISSDIDALNLTFDQAEIAAVKLDGFITSPGTVDWVFDTPVPSGARVVLVYQSSIPSLITDAPNNSRLGHQNISGGPATTWVTTKTIEDAGIDSIPFAIVYDPATGVVLKYTSGTAGAGEWEYNVSTRTITTGDVLNDICVFYTAEKDAD